MVYNDIGWSNVAFSGNHVKLLKFTSPATGKYRQKVYISGIYCFSLDNQVKRLGKTTSS